MTILSVISKVIDKIAQLEAIQKGQQAKPSRWISVFQISSDLRERAFIYSIRGGHGASLTSLEKDFSNLKRSEQ